MSDQINPLSRGEGPIADLYRQYADWLRSRLRRRFGEEAEDLVQETYVRLARLEGGVIRHPKALLLTVASNIAINGHRRRLRSAEHQKGVLTEEAGSQAATQAEGVLLKQIILSMPEGPRTVFLLSRFSGLGYDAIAERLGLSVKTVEWRMSKALAHCKSQMRD